MNKSEQMPNKAISGGIKILKPINGVVIPFEKDMSLEGLKIGFLFLGRELIKYKIVSHKGNFIEVTSYNPLTGEVRANAKSTLRLLLSTLNSKYTWFYTK